MNQLPILCIKKVIERNESTDEIYYKNGMKKYDNGNLP